MLHALITEQGKKTSDQIFSEETEQNHNVAELATPPRDLPLKAAESYLLWYDRAELIDNKLQGMSGVAAANKISVQAVIYYCMERAAA